MNKGILIGIIVLSLLICCGCADKQDSRETKREKEALSVEVNTDPIFSEDDYWEEYMLDGINVSDTGEYVSIYSEKEVYYTTDEYISCILKGTELGTGFYYYGIPYIEKYEDDTWIRLQHNSKNIAMAQWCICAEEDGEDRYASCKLSVTLDNVSSRIDEGTYRFVVFFPDKVMYALFEMRGGK
ncbi:MAG: hypothetical protein E7266_00485 [Lachnospiraceae bacterium]|nr:hypothetical protein [Lachnospiraceae bacterium]